MGTFLNESAWVRCLDRRSAAGAVDKRRQPRSDRAGGVISRGDLATEIVERAQKLRIEAFAAMRVRQRLGFERHGRQGSGRRRRLRFELQLLMKLDKVVDDAGVVHLAPALGQ